MQEYLEESLVRLGRAAGWPGELVTATAKAQEEESRTQAGVRVNATPKPEVPKAVRDLIAQQNSLDMQLYDYAVRLFQRETVVLATQ